MIAVSEWWTVLKKADLINILIILIFQWNLIFPVFTTSDHSFEPFCWSVDQLPNMEDVTHQRLGLFKSIFWIYVDLFKIVVSESRVLTFQLYWEFIAVLGRSSICCVTYKPVFKYILNVNGKIKGYYIPKSIQNVIILQHLSLPLRSSFQSTTLTIVFDNAALTYSIIFCYLKKSIWCFVDCTKPINQSIFFWIIHAQYFIMLLLWIRFIIANS